MFDFLKKKLNKTIKDASDSIPEEEMTQHDKEFAKDLDNLEEAFSSIEDKYSKDSSEEDAPEDVEDKVEDADKLDADTDDESVIEDDASDSEDDASTTGDDAEDAQASEESDKEDEEIDREDTAEDNQEESQEDSDEKDSESTDEIDEDKKEKKGRFSFFRRNKKEETKGSPEEAKDEKLADEEDIEENTPDEEDTEEDESTESTDDDEIDEDKKEKKGRFSFFKRNKKEESEEDIIEESKDNESEEEKTSESPKASVKDESESGGMFSFITKKTIKEEDIEDILDELFMSLLEGDVAYEVADRIVESVKEDLIGKKIQRRGDMELFTTNALKNAITEIIDNGSYDLLGEIEKSKQNGEPYKIMFVGINGTGKTTTIAKMAKYLEKHGYSSVFGASDTFRAGAIEQLEHHAKNLNLKIIKHERNSDPAAVAFDAVEHAKATGKDVVLIDTSGRMQTNANLMDEMK
ncbi:MAG: signal recognition particle-docking protein FtsY, partial [Methanosphaera sp. rholeuAM130]